MKKRAVHPRTAQIAKLTNTMKRKLTAEVKPGLVIDLGGVSIPINTRAAAQLRELARRKKIQPQDLALQILIEAVKPEPELEELAEYQFDSGNDHQLYQDRHGRLFINRNRFGGGLPEPIGEMAAIKDFLKGACCDAWGKRIWRLIKKCKEAA